MHSCGVEKVESTDNSKKGNKNHLYFTTQKLLLSFCDILSVVSVMFFSYKKKWIKFYVESLT